MGRDAPPNGDCGRGLAYLHEKLHGIPIVILLVRQHTLQNCADIVAHMPAAGYGESGKLRITYDCVMDLRKRFRHAAVPEQKIPVPPCGLRRNRVHPASGAKGLLGCRDIARSFISVSQIHPIRRGLWIQGNGALIIGDRQRQIGMLQVKLPGSAELVPPLRIRGLDFRRPQQ